MTSQIAKRVSASQPAIILATALAACLIHRWPATVAVFLALQAGIVLAAWGTGHRRAGPDRSLRFLSRALAIPEPPGPPLPRSRRAHLRLLP